jgi:hypothetical protein
MTLKWKEEACLVLDKLGMTQGNFGIEGVRGEDRRAFGLPGR